MNATTLIIAYRNWLRSNSAMSAALQDTLRGGKLPQHVVQELAQVHAAHYDAYVAQADNGGWRFYTCEEATSKNRHAAAQRQWDRSVAKYHNVQRKEGTRSKTEPQVRLAALYNKLTAAQKRAFLHTIGF